MRELQTIIEEIERLKNAGENAVLATVIDVQGSSYRLPGAKMFLTRDGQTFGTVSGGCLEADVLERAQKVSQAGAAAVITYDTRGRDDSVFSLDMGCNGVIRILLEPFGGENPLLKIWRTALEKRRKQVVATLVSAANGAEIGGRIFYDEAGRFDFEKLTAFLENLPELREDCRRLSSENAISQTRVYKSAHGEFEFFLEAIIPPPALFIFGGGYDAIPLADFAKKLGWRVAVVDHRPAFAAHKRFPSADEIVLSRAEESIEELSLDEHSFAVVMTHNYARDKEILRQLLKGDPVRYVGALGPKRRTQDILRELREEGETLPPENLARLHAPVGLDVGAETPEAIALSIAAEIQSVLANRAAGFLRDRRGSIYERARRDQNPG